MKNEKNKIRLIAPSPEMKNRVMDYRAEFIAAKEETIFGSCGLHRYKRFEEWLHAARETAAGRPPEGRLPATTFVAVRISDDLIVGTANIRHYLTESTLHSGHIGYAVRPALRGKGYGAEILRQALIKAEQMGIIETIVSCKQQNLPSKRVIEKNGLLFERACQEDEETVLVYRKPL